MSTCPYCKSSFTHVNIKQVSGKSPNRSWVCISYNCPSCDASLSVAIDPIALKNDTVEEVAKKVRS
jgi:hypothetical protein